MTEYSIYPITILPWIFWMFVCFHKLNLTLFHTLRFVEFDIEAIDTIIECFFKPKKYDIIVHFTEPGKTTLISFLNENNKLCESRVKN